MAKKKLIMWGFGLSVFHLVITLVTFCIAYNDVMADFDRDEPTPPTCIQRTADVLTPILMQPFLSTWTPWMSEHMPLPRLVEWFALFASSMVWGFGVIAIFEGLRKAVGHR
jgi:hypothetical protein